MAVSQQQQNTTGFKSCFFRKEYYKHGENAINKNCIVCTCLDGIVECNKQDPIDWCPPLNCSEENQVQIPKNCCKKCKSYTNYCGRRHLCHPNAKCINLATRFKCICQNGYRGTGISCEDIDECKSNDHSCETNTKCINLVGSYRCEHPEKVCQNGSSSYSSDSNTITVVDRLIQGLLYSGCFWVIGLCIFAIGYQIYKC